MAAGDSATPTPWWKNKARMAAGAAVLVAVVLVAVLVPTLSNKQAKTSSGVSGGGFVTDKASGVSPSEMTTVMNALLVANTPADLPADLAAKQAGIKPNTTPATTTTVPVVPVSGGSKEEADKAPANSITTRMWPALAGAGGPGGNPTVCYPKNGTEVVAMSKPESRCTVIMLTNPGSKPYDITQQMNITTTKIFIGNPIDMPKLNATGKTIHRLFEVRAGGRLELRAIRLYRAPPEILPTNFKLFAGGTVRVLLGGEFTAYGCIFLLQPQTVQSFLRELDSPLSRYRLIGGHVLVLGGNVRLIGCQAFRWQPYGNPILNVIQIGREVAVIAGNCVAVGFFDAVGTAFLSAINVGNIFAVLGGTGVLIGGGNINAAVANNQLGAGKNLFVGGGVLITTGYQNIGAFLLLLRSGFATHAVGAGVLIHIGHIHTRVWAIAAVLNAGQTHSVGAGILQKLGGVLITQNQNFVFAGAGGNTFVGSGDAYWLGAPTTRSLLTTSQHGAGGVWFNGAGYVNVIGVPSASVNMVRAQYIVGGETFIGAGIVNYIQFKRFNTQLCNAFFGQGTQIFNGWGGVSLVNSFSRNRRPVFYQTPNVAGVFVGGRRLGGINRNQWATAKKVIVYNNKTNANKKLLPWWQPKNKTRVLLDTDATPAGLAMDIPSYLFMVQSSMDDNSKPVIASEDFNINEKTPAVGTQNVLKGYHALIDFMVKQQQADQADAANAPVASGETKVSIPDDAECFLCNVAPLPTADHVMNGKCHTSDACKGATAAEAVQAAAKEYLPKALPIDATVAQILGVDVSGRRLAPASDVPGSSPINLPDSNLIWSEISIYCPTSAAAAADTSAVAAKCVDEKLLKAAMQAYLDPMTGFSVAVAPQEVHAAVADVVTDDLKEAILPTPNNDQACMMGTKYSLYLSTLDNAQVPDLEAAMKTIQADPANFLDYLNAAKDALQDTGAKACALSLTPKTSVAFPPVEKMPAFKPQSLGLVGPSVSMGTADSIVPVSEAVKGKEHTLFLQNFPANSAYEVKLIQGTALDGPVIATVDGSEMGKDGVAETKWTVPAGMEADPDSRYYLKASLKGLPAFFTVSQPFFIRDQATPGRRW